MLRFMIRATTQLALGIRPITTSQDPRMEEYLFLLRTFGSAQSVQMSTTVTASFPVRQSTTATNRETMRGWYPLAACRIQFGQIAGANSIRPVAADCRI